MKKNYLTFVFCLIFQIYLFGQSISTPIVQPQSPFTNTPVKIFVTVNTPNIGGVIYLSHTTDTAQKIINIVGCYDFGMLSMPISLTSSLNIGLLPTGNYTVNMKAYLSYTPSFCSKTDSLMTSTIFTVSSSTVISSCNAHDSIVKKYKNDADRLALRRVNYVNDTYKDSVIIKKPLSKSYLNALLAVYNATALPARDTVVNAFKIHAYCNPGMNYIVVEADSNISWVNNLIHNVFPTGQTQFDNLYSKYYLHKTIHFGATAAQFIVMVTDTNYNTAALYPKFALVPGVIQAYDDDCFTHSRNITDSINTNFTILTYKYGWGDCIAGCIYYRFWKFKIFNDCSVEYIGSYGDPLSPSAFVGIKENQNNFPELKIYPNPASDILNIEFLNTERSTSSKLHIINSFGQTVREEEIYFENGKAKINVKQLTSGIYTVRFTSKYNYSIKFIKD